MKKLVCTVSCMFFMICFTFTQNGELENLFNNEDYDDCIKYAEEVLKEDSENVIAHFYKGLSLARQEKFTMAESSLLKANELGYQPIIRVHINLLTIYANLDRKKDLVDFLSKIAKQGFSAQSFLKGPEFEKFQNDLDFKNAFERVLKNAYPCRYDPNNQKLDFWLGSWEIYANNGNKIAVSAITKSNDGCTLYEDYATVREFYGRSMNYFDVADSLYTQIWIDQRNNLTKYKEVNTKEGYLQMQADQGGGNLSRMSWQFDENEHTVLQIAESTTDKGINWTTGFSGLYKLKEKKIMED